MMNCRHCGVELRHRFLDLGFAPPSNAYLQPQDLNRPESYLPLRVAVCSNCWLVQTEDFTQADALFNEEYAYFSSTSASWLRHAANYCRDVVSTLQLDSNSLVVEVASNDGYLLRNFIEAGIPCLGIEPTGSTARAARAIGVPVLERFFGQALAEELALQGQQADLIIGNNVYAHVPNINDFTRGLRALLKPEGVVTLEFPTLQELVDKALFDTVYHEHYSYLCLSVVVRIFAQAGLRVWDVERLSTHGGSLRIFGCRTESDRLTSARVQKVLDQEERAGLMDMSTYLGFQARAERIKDDLLLFLIEQKREGRKVAAYGAAAKGNTLLNFAGIKADLLPYVCDGAEAKQGRFMPGSHMPICHPRRIFEDRPAVVLVLPWNICEEVVELLKPIVDRGTAVYVAVPELRRLA